MRIRKIFQRKIASILEISRDMNREVINVYKDNQTLCHQRGVHQKLNTDIKRRIDEPTLSDANLYDQKMLISLNMKVK
jgi:hypothetical protein